MPLNLRMNADLNRPGLEAGRGLPVFAFFTKTAKKTTKTV
ncbi:hypothetical protein EDC90_100755 [Martelella mediterranea]|uniref:Uncharacterized protein n=1 Tax=Martelella mediterranea TaxID=293089 RepID=A0A4R3NZK0_9HYPH|nr:hypothetical protein EDC90_100755 [Martelella mediterranea]